MKSHASVLLEVAKTVYIDACFACSATVSIRDIKTLVSRVENGGISFLTITLPTFCADFEQALRFGQILPAHFQNFRKCGTIPAFLQSMLENVFDRDTGRIKIDDESFDAPNRFHSYVDSIRQFCLAFKKVELPCSPKRVSKAIRSFIEIEASFQQFAPTEVQTDYFLSVSRCIWDNMLVSIDTNSVIPRHGPGATADGRSGNQKFRWREWYERLEPYLPLVDGGFPITCGELYNDRSELESVRFVPQDYEVPVKVTPVPKTLKGPRIIAIEPCCMQYAQQGIRDVLYDVIESHPLTSGHVNFRDQTVNGSLAMLASRDGRLATIDLSDASDRVPLSLVREMFRANPNLWDFIDACRSTRASLPNGSIIGPLQKFASMGSALCFPIEAMYFYTICVMASLKARALPVSIAAVSDVSRDIYVYGDDILVPTDIAEVVLEMLTEYNCKPNTNKTFWTGKFRESCGVDAFNGYLVTPVYLRKTPPQHKRQSHEIVSAVATANLFYKKGYLRTATLLFELIEKVTGPLPSVSEHSPVIGRSFPWDANRTLMKYRVNPKTQTREIRALVPSPVYRTDELDGYAALFKCLMKLEGFIPSAESPTTFQSIDDYVDYVEVIASTDRKHLERTARHGAVAVNRRWVPVHLLE